MGLRSWSLLIATKLQKRQEDIYQAYCTTDEAVARLDQMRQLVDEEFADWFQEAEEL